VHVIALDTRRVRVAGRAAVALGLMLAVLLLGAPSSAGASPLRRLAASVTSFATDGVRYAAWQHTPTSPIVILDTATGTRRAARVPGCVLDAEEPQRDENEPIAGGGWFLLSCFEEPRNSCFIAIYKTLLRCGEKLENETASEKESRQTVSRLLNARTGMSLPLPAGGGWARVGALYVEGGSCLRPTHCSAAFYDLATGTVTERPGSDQQSSLTKANLNLPGAPLEQVCTALRRKVLSARKEADEGEVAWSNTALVHPTRDRRNVRLERCHARPLILPGPREPIRYIKLRGPEGHVTSERLLPSEPNGFDLRDGALTWSTGHDATSDNPYQEAVEYGTLTAYQLSSGKVHTWRLPSLSLHGAPEEGIPGVFGYSTHTLNTVFWLAAQDLTGGEAGVCCVETAYLYGATF
jgi:hypothetical protein